MPSQRQNHVPSPASSQGAPLSQGSEQQAPVVRPEGVPDNHLEGTNIFQAKTFREEFLAEFIDTSIFQK